MPGPGGCVLVPGCAWKACLTGRHRPRAWRRADLVQIGVGERGMVLGKNECSTTKEQRPSDGVRHLLEWLDRVLAFFFVWLDLPRAGAELQKPQLACRWLMAKNDRRV